MAELELAVWKRNAFSFVGAERGREVESVSCISEIGRSGSGCNATTCRSQTARSCSGWRKSHVKLSFVLLLPTPPPSCNISHLLGIYTGLRFCRLSFKGVPLNYSDSVNAGLVTDDPK